MPISELAKDLQEEVEASEEKEEDDVLQEEADASEEEGEEADTSE